VKRYIVRNEIITLPGKRPYRATHLFTVVNKATGEVVYRGATSRALAATLADKLNRETNEETS
jgi:hypothetical protein